MPGTKLSLTLPYEEGTIIILKIENRKPNKLKDQSRKCNNSLKSFAFIKKNPTQQTEKCSEWKRNDHKSQNSFNKKPMCKHL